MSIFSQPGFRNRVSLRPRPGEEEAQAMTVGSGEKLLTLYERFGPVGASLKTCVASLVLKGEWFSSLCYLNWKPLITKSGVLLYQLAPKTLRTGGIESGLWPTMRSGLTGNITPGRSKDKFNNLESVLARQMWPTPRTQMAHGYCKSRVANPEQAQKERRIEDIVAVESGTTGQLNADWVELLMSYPKNWTTLGDQDGKMEPQESSRDKKTV